MNKHKAVVITGASSGLGQCLYESFSETYKVINISRSKSPCEENIIIDLNDSTGLIKTLKATSLNHDLCILNAGTMGNIGTATQIDNRDLLEAIKINVISNKIIIDWSILNGCMNFIGISSGAATKNYDGWLNYCVSKSAFRTLLLQYQKDLPDFRFRLISPGVLRTNMNKKIKALDVNLFPDMQKFHQVSAVEPRKASEIIYQKYQDFFCSNRLEIDLRNEDEW